MKRRGFLKALGIGLAATQVKPTEADWAIDKTQPPMSVADLDPAYKGLFADLPETIDTYSNDSSAVVTIRPATYMACTVSTVCSADGKS